MTPEIEREGAEAPSFDPSAVLRELLTDWRIPDDSDVPAEVDDRPPCPEGWNGESFSFAELVQHEAAGYRAWGNDIGQFLAREMERLAEAIRFTGAVTPAEHDARMDVWEGEIRERWEAIEYESGKRDCQCGRCPRE